MRAAARWTSAVVLAAIASVAFAVSFEALSDLAERTGGMPDGLGWTLPVLLDGLVISGAVGALAHGLDGARSREAAYPWALVACGALASLAGNIMHAPPTLAARVIAAVPPLALLASFEALMRELRRAGRAPAVETVSDPVESVSASVPAVAERAPERTEPARTLTAAERERVRRGWKRGLDAATIAERTGLPVAAVSERVAAWASNGHQRTDAHA